MTPDRGVVGLAPPPPPRVLKAMNMVARPLLRSRLGKHFPGVMLLQFQARRTGRVMRIPVTINLVDGVPMAFTDAARRHNFTATIPVTVSHAGEVYETTGTLVPKSPARWARPCSPTFGHKLSRAEALEHPRVHDFWRVVDFLLEREPAINHHVYAHLPDRSTGPRWWRRLPRVASVASHQRPERIARQRRVGR